MEWQQRFRACLGLAQDQEELEKPGMIGTRSMFRAVAAFEEQGGKAYTVRLGRTSAAGAGEVFSSARS